MNNKKIIVAFLTALFLISGIEGQSRSSEETVEEAYLKNTVKAQIIKSQAESLDRDMKMIALQDIDRMIQNGEVSEGNSQIVDILSGLAAEGIDKQVVENGRLVNNFVMVRVEAVRLLGDIGGAEARNAILRVFKNENEALVLSTAVLALSKTGLDDAGEVLNVISWAMHSQTTVNKDNTFANAALSAIQILAKENGGVNSKNIFKEITSIADPRSGYITVVRLKALQLLNELQSYY